MSTESLALQQAQALVKEQQEQMRRQAEQALRDQAEFKAAVGEKDNELVKARKLVAGAEGIRKAQEWADRIMCQGIQPTQGEKEKELGAMAQAEGLRKPTAPVEAAATALGSRKLAVPAKSKGKLGSGMAGSSTSSVAGLSSAATKTQHRLALPSMATVQSSPDLGFGGM